MKRIVFWGASGQAKVLRPIVEAQGFTLVAIFDSRHDAAPPFPDVPLRCGEHGFADWADLARDTYCLSAIGGHRGADRLDRQNYMLRHGFIPAIAVHSRACVESGTKIGAGSQLLASATICVDAILGQACIINTNATVDHECRLGDGVHIGPGATLCGLVDVGDCAFVGAGAVILPRIKIGRNAIVGAGAVVVRDVGDGVTVYGNPAKLG
jgi:sugar O-acyltransferase (sialic acid O-acetyltransferase NeuD family)